MAAYAALLSLAQTTRPQHETLFSTDAAEKVKSIHNYANSFLWFFEKNPEKVNHWEGRINDLAYEIDTIIQNSMLLRSQSREEVMNPSLEEQLENVVKELGLINGEIKEERPTLSPTSSSSSTPPTVGNESTVGLEKSMRDLKERLCGEASNLQVIPIAGMGGIGKTTLARALYNDQLIVEHFHIRAWAVASPDYSPRRFRRNLLESMIVFGKPMLANKMDENDTTSEVFKTLKDVRYLIVIDDVWENNVWDDVKSMFPDDYNGSRIMLTTRRLDVAVHPHSAGHVHEMECMDESLSLDLLRKKVFTDGECPPEFEGVGKEIVGRCGGLPLAIVIVAGILSMPISNPSKSTWRETAENVIQIVGQDQDLEAILSLSYTHLPHHLRSCFLFLGGFQKDVTIRTSRLIKLWAAEGFERMEERSQKSLEEKAEEYLEELVKRNLVLVTKRKIDGKIKSCGLHDLVRDLCMRKAHEEKFFHVMDGHDLPQGLGDARRISISRSNVGLVSSPTLRTILCIQIQKVPGWLGTLGEYKLLKELDALGVDLKELPSQVFELYHLRYLALMGSFTIPADISNLVHLQTLIIQASGKLSGRHASVEPLSLPLEIWGLTQLRHLLFHAPYMLPHPPQGSVTHPLQYLQTLSLIADLAWNKEILQLIPNVKRLGLTYTSNKEHHLHLLKNLHQLEKLEVIGHKDFSWKVQNPSFPPTLKKLILVGGGFPWSNMAIVGSLPNLEVLKLRDNACAGEKWETDATRGFPSLTVLLIDKSNLIKWEVESDSFPRLKRLVLSSCLKLEAIPEDIGEIPTLELIEVDSLTKPLLESAMQIKENQEDNGNFYLQVRVSHQAKMG